MSLAEKLLSWRERKGITQVEAAKFIGVTPKSYQFWEYGKTEPRVTKMRQIKEAIGDADSRDQHESIKYLKHDEGKWKLQDADPGYKEIVEMFCHHRAEYCVLLAMNGDNMAPAIQDGDLIIAEETDHIDRDARYVMLSMDRTLCMVKRCQVTTDHINALSDNPLFPPAIINEDDVLVIGRVIYPNDPAQS